MNLPVVIVTDERFLRYENAVFTESMSGLGFWQRYLAVFSEVLVVARVKTVNEIDSKLLRADGSGVMFYDLPYYLGPVKGIQQIPTILRHLWQVSGKSDAVILRIPSALGILFWTVLRVRNQPFAVEVVGDPYDSLSPQALGESYATRFRTIAVAAQKKQCWQAIATAYVTDKTLQERYPPNQAKDRFTTHYSSLELPIQLIIDAQQYRQATNWQPFYQTNRPPRLIFVGSLAQRYKGLHILLNALTCLKTQEIPFTLTVLGDGAYRAEYETMAQELGLSHHVVFEGQLPRGMPVLQALCQSDLFVLPSLVEALPRALLEAMACGLPCIASTIGGVPELLPEEDRIPPGNVALLAEKITEVLADPARLTAMQVRNLATAEQYREDILQKRREAFYQFVANYRHIKP
jgi:glycosyltransferase involved in cell wall biosynthesis